MKRIVLVLLRAGWMYRNFLMLSCFKIYITLGFRFLG